MCSPDEICSKRENVHSHGYFSLHRSGCLSRESLPLCLESLHQRISTCSTTTYIEENRTYMIQELDGHAHVWRGPSDDNKSLAIRRARATSWGRTWLHDPNLAGAHTPDLIDLASPLANNTSYKIVWNKDLLGLLRDRWVRRCKCVSSG